MKNKAKVSIAIFDNVSIVDSLEDEELFVFPVYQSAEANPVIDYLIERKSLKEIKKAIASNERAGTVKIFKDKEGKKYMLYWVASQKVNSIAILSDMLSAALKTGAKEIAMSLIGVDEFGYSESSCIVEESSFYETFLSSHPDMTINLYVPDREHRLQSGIHEAAFGDEKMVYYERESDYSADRPTIYLDANAIGSYLDYYLAYISARIEAGCQIPIFGHLNDNIDDRIEALNWMFRAATGIEYKFSRFSGKQKGKDGKDYYPRPSKEIALLTVMVLDMTYEEAKECLNYFGYGFAAFDNVDRYVAYALRNFERPLNIKAIDHEIKKRFGASAALLDSKKPEGKKQ